MGVSQLDLEGVLSLIGGFVENGLPVGLSELLAAFGGHLPITLLFEKTLIRSTKDILIACLREKNAVSAIENKMKVQEVSMYLLQSGLFSMSQGAALQASDTVADGASGADAGSSSGSGLPAPPAELGDTKQLLSSTSSSSGAGLGNSETKQLLSNSAEDTDRTMAAVATAVRAAIGRPAAQGLAENPLRSEFASLSVGGIYQPAGPAQDVQEIYNLANARMGSYNAQGPPLSGPELQHQEQRQQQPPPQQQQQQPPQQQQPQQRQQQQQPQQWQQKWGQKILVDPPISVNPPIFQQRIHHHQQPQNGPEPSGRQFGDQLGQGDAYGHNHGHGHHGGQQFNQGFQQQQLQQQLQQQQQQQWLQQQLLQQQQLQEQQRQRGQGQQQRQRQEPRRGQQQQSQQPLQQQQLPEELRWLGQQQPQHHPQPQQFCEGFERQGFDRSPYPVNSGDGAWDNVQAPSNMLSSYSAPYNMSAGGGYPAPQLDMSRTPLSDLYAYSGNADAFSFCYKWDQETVRTMVKRMEYINMKNLRDKTAAWNAQKRSSENVDFKDFHPPAPYAVHDRAGGLVEHMAPDYLREISKQGYANLTVYIQTRYPMPPDPAKSKAMMGFLSECYSTVAQLDRALSAPPCVRQKQDDDCIEMQIRRLMALEMAKADGHWKTAIYAESRLVYRPQAGLPITPSIQTSLRKHAKALAGLAKAD
jgi:hypothetical protein